MSEGTDNGLHIPTDEICDAIIASELEIEFWIKNSRLLRSLISKFVELKEEKLDLKNPANTEFRLIERYDCTHGAQMVVPYLSFWKSYRLFLDSN